jgi:nitroreductase
MDVYQAIKNRYSCRSYKAEPVPDEKLKRILEAARLAPSAHNEQEWKFVVVKDVEKRNQLSEAAGQSFIAEAPVIIVAVATEPEHVLRSGVPAYAVDLAIAIEHMALQATEEGLGTCWIGAFDQEEVKKILEIPEECKVVALLPLGFPADKPKLKSRKRLEEIISYEKF